MSQSRDSHPNGLLFFSATASLHYTGWGATLVMRCFSYISNLSLTFHNQLPTAIIV